MTLVETDQLTQNQQTIRFIAGLLLELGARERLPPIQEINTQIKVGAGTVQKAMAMLREAGAVAVSAHGHKGTFVDRLDYGRLWNFAGRGPVRLLLPFVDAPEFRGLSEGLDHTFANRGVRARIDHRRGAAARMQSVLDGDHDACIVSELAFQRGADASALDGVALGEVNYYQEGSVTVLLRRDADTSALRIGYDPASLDHYLLTQAEFPADDDSHVRVPCPYAHLLSALLAGIVDCGIWHRVDIGISLDLLPVTARAPERPETRSLLGSCEQAWFAFRRDRRDIRNLLTLVDMKAIKTMQVEARGENRADEEALKALIAEHSRPPGEPR